jgi:tRNA A-37 threonylcarbamoyl transferase component Bud32/tellurite resistance protein
VSSNQPPFDGPPLLSEIVGGGASPPPAAAADPLVGTTLAGRYRISKRLGDGGMGSVYLAEHTILRKPVALKLLKPEFNADASLVERFFREARATAAIQHEHVVEIVDFGQTPEYAFFVMEALSGCELTELIGRGRRLPWNRSKAIMLQVVSALAAAHEAGIVHRDMKPGNVFLIQRGDTPDYVKVLDFGIAKINDGVQLTQAGMVFGTAAYMAPEQATGGEVDGRTDIYAVGCLLFEMLTGRLPFPGDNFMKVLSQHIREQAPRLREVVPDLDIPPGVEELVARMLAKFPSDRFASMVELEQALLAIPEHHGVGDAYAYGSPGVGQTAPTAMLDGMGAAQLLDAARLGLEPARLGTLAYLFVAFAHGTDGVLTNTEMRALADRLRAWAPQLSLEQIGNILREAVGNYGRTPNKPAALRDCRVALKAWFTPDRHEQVIADLRAIAVADGRFDAAEQQFIDETARSFGLAPEPMTRSLAFIYLALAHAADGAIDGEEMRVIGELLRQWAPEASLAEIGELLRDSVGEYKCLAGAEARLDRARAAADALKQTTPQETLRRVLADLWRLAGSDGHISPEEQRLIMEIVERFNA